MLCKDRVITMAVKKNNSDFWTSSAFKGTVAVLATLLAVVIIILICAKVLFVSNSSQENIKTGRITSTDPLPVTTTVKTTTQAKKLPKKQQRITITTTTKRIIRSKK